MHKTSNVPSVVAAPVIVRGFTVPQTAVAMMEAAAMRVAAILDPILLLPPATILCTAPVPLI